jgi:hypothetical protein
MGFNNKNIFYGDSLETLRDKINSNFWGSYFNGIGDKGEIGDVGPTGQPGEVGSPGSRGLTGVPASNWFFSETPPTGSVKEYDLWVDLSSSTKEIYIYSISGWAPSGENFQSSGSFFTLPGISGPGEITTSNGISINKTPQSEYSLVINSKSLDDNNANKNFAKLLISADDSSLSNRKPVLSFGKTFYTDAKKMPFFGWKGSSSDYSIGLSGGNSFEFLGTSVSLDSSLGVTGSSNIFSIRSLVGATLSSAGTLSLNTSILGISGPNFYLDGSKSESRKRMSAGNLSIQTGGTGIDSSTTSATGENLLYSSSWITTPTNRKKSLSVTSDGSMGIIKAGVTGATGSTTDNFHAYLVKKYSSLPVIAYSTSDFLINNGFYDSIGGTQSVSFIGGVNITITISSARRSLVSFFASDRVVLQTYDYFSGIYSPGYSFEYEVLSYNRSTGSLVLIPQFANSYFYSSVDWTLQSYSPSGTISGLDPLFSYMIDNFLLSDPQNVSGGSIIPIDSLVFYSIEIPTDVFIGETIEKKYYVNSSTYGVGGIAITNNFERIFLVRTLTTGTSCKSFTIKYIPIGDGVVKIYLEVHDGPNSFTWIKEYGG